MKETGQRNNIREVEEVLLNLNGWDDICFRADSGCKYARDRQTFFEYCTSNAFEECPHSNREIKVKTFHGAIKLLLDNRY